ncbi:MAG: CdaR family protein [Bacilli bacterium]|nr:CdaR family protein [Bacilli bacterium]
MNKIFNLIASFFKGIYNIIDKYIVTPISKIIYNIDKKVNKSGGKIEKILNRPNMLLYMSLALAIIVFLLIDSKVITLVETEAEIITNQQVNVEYNSEAYVIEDLPETVDITLIGRKSDLYLAKQLGENEVVLDLTDYAPRDEPYKVKLTYNQTINSLSYKLDPTYVYVTIKKKVSTLKTISYDLINQDKLNELNPELSVSNVELDKNEVVVKGSQDTLNKIATVKALIDLNNKNFKAKGTYNLENVPIVAYDETGNILKNVEIVPSKVNATVTFTSYSKEVPIEVQTTGNLVSGKAISSITINGKSEYYVTIYGEQSEIDSIDSLPVTIDVTDQGNNGSKTYPSNILKPSGVKYMSASSVNIVASFGEAKQKTIDGLTITVENTPANLKATATSQATISVQVIGVQSVIDSITASDIKAYIDLSGYTAGNHTVPVQVKGNNPMAQYIVSSSVNINITNK